MATAEVRITLYNSGGSGEREDFKLDTNGALGLLLSGAVLNRSGVNPTNNASVIWKMDTDVAELTLFKGFLLWTASKGLALI